MLSLLWRWFCCCLFIVCHCSHCVWVFSVWPWFCDIVSFMPTDCGRCSGVHVRPQRAIINWNSPATHRRRQPNSARPATVLAPISLGRLSRSATPPCLGFAQGPAGAGPLPPLLRGNPRSAPDSLLTICILDNISCFCCQKNISQTLSECQTVWIQIRMDILSVLIWVQTVCI